MYAAGTCCTVERTNAGQRLSRGCARSRRRLAVKPRIAFLGELTGAVAHEGSGARNAAKFALRGHPAGLGLTAFDDGGDPQRAVANAHRVIADPSVVAAVAHYSSTSALACVEAYRAAGFPVVIWGAGQDGITSADSRRYVFRIMYSWTLVMQRAAAWTARIHRKRLALIFEDSVFGRAHAAAFRDAARKNAITIAVDRPVTGARLDFAMDIDAIQGAGVDATMIVIPPAGWHHANPKAGTIVPGDGVPIAVKLIRQGLSTPVQGLAGVFNTPMLANIDDGAIGFGGGAPTALLARGAGLLAAYEAAGFAEPMAVMPPDANAAAELLADVVRHVGPQREAIAQALATTAGYASTIGNVNFDSTGQNIDAPSTTWITHGGKLDLLAIEPA